MIGIVTVVVIGIVALSAMSSAAVAEPTIIVPIPDTAEAHLYYNAVYEALGRAKRSIHIVMQRMTYYTEFPDSLSNRLIDGLVAAVERGVEVRVILERSDFSESINASNEAVARYLGEHGVEVRFESVEVTTNVRLVLIDGETVILGSTTWSYYPLERNNEVNLMIENNAEVASVFEQFFEQIWGASSAGLSPSALTI
ncbi:MAG: phospholipase D-like domain-containing protein [Candidatus Bipolaricaulia bacterium]